MRQLDFAVYISYMVSTKEINAPVLLTSLTKHMQASHPTMYSTLIMYLLSLMQLIKRTNNFKKKHIPHIKDTIQLSFFFAINPTGTIIFLSKCWGGRVSDTVLTRRNGGENYLAEPKLFILTNWRFVIGGSLRIFKFMAIYNWRK